MASLQHQSCVQWLEVAGDTTVDQMTHKLTFVDIASISKILNEKGLRSNIIKLKFTDKQNMPSEMDGWIYTTILYLRLHLIQEQNTRIKWGLPKIALIIDNI